MKREIQEPVESKPFLGDGRMYDHPAYGMISASRVTGHAALVGSDFIHDHFVKVCISHGALYRTLSHDWFGARDEIIEIAMSESQWATFVSSMNCGPGVPCTVDHIQGKEMPGVPHRLQHDEFKSELKADTEKIVAEIKATISDIELGNGISKTKKANILARLHRALKIADDEIPFAAQSFSEHMENTVEKAKVEVNAYVQATIMRAGLEAISSNPPILAIGSEQE